MIPFFIALVVLIFGSFVFQFFLPPVLILSGAAILFAPALYFYGCLSLPFPLMLALTFITGLLNDLFMVPQGKGHADYTAGVSILVYLVPGLIMQRVQTPVSQAPLGTPLAAGGNQRSLNPIYFSGAIRYPER